MKKATIETLACGLAVAAALAFAPPALSDHGGKRKFGGANGIEGAVFVMTNSTDTARGNEVVMYNRKADGTLDFLASFATGGLGSGAAPTSSVFGALIPAAADGLGSQDSLILGGRAKDRDDDKDKKKDKFKDQRQIFAVNAGNNTITCFVVTRDGLRSRRTVHSGGMFPVGLTFRKGSLYVLNAGGIGSIKGFKVSANCAMRQLPGSWRSLAPVFATIDPPFPDPAPNEVLTTPAQIAFTPDGRRLVVAIKGGPPSFGGGVAVYGVRSNGRLESGGPTVTPFSTADNLGGPFSFVFDRRGNLLLNHVNSFTFASHRIEPSGALTPISAPIQISALGDGSPLQFAAFNCWVARHDNLAYVMSFGDIPATSGGLPDGPGIISALEIANDGDLSLLGVNDLGGEGIVAILPQDDRDLFPGAGSVFGNHGIDLTKVDGRRGSFLYAVEPRVGAIGQWEINGDGTLTGLGSAGGLAEGLDPFAGTNPGINDFRERCFNQPDGSRNPECALGSAQGIVGF